MASLASSPRILAEGDGAKITFDDHIVPILREKCFSCHNPDRERGGLSLTTYARTMEGGSSGTVVSAGDPDSSRLYLLVAQKEEPFMPPKSDKLPDDLLETIRKWIAGGALENAGSKAAAAKPALPAALPVAGAAKPDGPPPMPEGLTLDPVVRTPRPDAVVALAASPWAPLVATGGQGQVLLHNPDTLELLGVLPFPEGQPRVLKFSRNGTLLLAGGGHAAKSGKVVVWNVTTGARAIEVGDELDSVLAADIDATQSRIALGGPAKVARLYSTGGDLLAEIRKHTDWVLALEFSPDGVLLATADRAGGLWVWEARTGREYLTLEGHGVPITDLSWRADGNVLATCGEDGTVRMWEMDNGTSVKRWNAHGGGALSVEYFRDGRLVTSGRDRLVKVWKADGSLERQLDTMAEIATACAISHDGGRVLGGDLLGELKVWSAAEGKALGSLVLNPPTREERVEVATRTLAERTAELDARSKAAGEAQAEVERLASALDAARKAVEEKASAVKAAEASVAEARAAIERAQAGR